LNKRRVVVTGLGMISPLGIGNEATWQGLVAGRSGIGRITKFDTTDYTCQIAGEVRGFKPEDWMDKKEVKKSDTFIHYAIAAAQLAVNDAGIDCPKCDGERMGVIIGSGIGGLPLIEEMHRKLLERGPSRISPFFIPGLIVNLASGHISMKFGLKGPSSAPATACATGAHSIGDAFKIIQRDEADVMFAGGSEAVVSALAIGGFAALRARTTRNDEPERASRPWDKERDGFVLGEGAGVLILEELEHAQRRGATIYCELTGYGMSSDAHHMTSPDQNGMARGMIRALKDAGLDPSQVDYVNAHATSTPVGDVTENEAIKQVFGEHARKLAISSTKSMTGHLLGAAGGIEAAIAAMTFRANVIPPTINYENPDPECDLDYVPNKAREAVVNHVVSNSFGFGGTNATLVFSRFEQ
jgi:3-oxoacyl-[acyl-carrier-protein] synthase II